MCKIAAFGDKESISIFSSVGIETFVFADSLKAGEKIDEVANDFGIIFITEALAKDLNNIINKYRDLITPAIILIPSVKGSTGDALLQLKESVIKAVGTDITFNG